MKPSGAPCCNVFVRDGTEKGSGACDENQVVEKGVSGLWIAVPHGILRARCTSLSARVVKLVDTGDLKSPGHCGRAGSSPAPGTNFQLCLGFRYTVNESYPMYRSDDVVGGFEL